MASKEDSQREFRVKIGKLNTEALRRKLIAHGYDEQEVTSWSREQMLKEMMEAQIGAPPSSQAPDMEAVLRLIQQQQEAADRRQQEQQEATRQQMSAQQEATRQQLSAQQEAADRRQQDALEQLI